VKSYIFKWPKPVHNLQGNEITCRTKPPGPDGSSPRALVECRTEVQFGTNNTLQIATLFLGPFKQCLRITLQDRISTNGPGERESGVCKFELLVIGPALANNLIVEVNHWVSIATKLSIHSCFPVND